MRTGFWNGAEVHQYVLCLELEGGHGTAIVWPERFKRFVIPGLRFLIDQMYSLESPFQFLTKDTLYP